LRIATLGSYDIFYYYVMFYSFAETPFADIDAPQPSSPHYLATSPANFPAVRAYDQAADGQAFNMYTTRCSNIHLVNTLLRVAPR
jgi:hypothetical protein